MPLLVLSRSEYAGTSAALPQLRQLLQITPASGFPQWRILRKEHHLLSVRINAVGFAIRRLIILFVGRFASAPCLENFHMEQWFLSCCLFAAVVNAKYGLGRSFSLLLQLQSSSPLVSSWNLARRIIWLPSGC